MKSFFEELTGYRVKVEKDGKEVVNVPGILCLPGLLAAPKLGIIGMIAAPLLGCSVHLENADGKEVDVGESVRKAADTVIDTAKTAAMTIREEVDKAMDAASADDPAEEDRKAEDGSGADEAPTIHVGRDDSDKE